MKQKYVRRAFENITKDIRYTMEGASDIDFTNVGNDIVVCNGIEYATSEGFSFVVPFFGTIDETLYNISFPNPAGDNKVTLVRTYHIEK